MRALIIKPDSFKSDNEIKKDFISDLEPEFEALYKYLEQNKHDVHIHSYDTKNAWKTRKVPILHKVHEVKPKLLYFMCYGRSDMIDAGFNRDNVSDLYNVYRHVQKIVLFCNSAGKTKNSFAKNLARCYKNNLCEVYSNTTAGHPTKNPNIVIHNSLHFNYDWQGAKVDLDSKLFHYTVFCYHAFKQYLEEDPDFRFRYVFMNMNDIMYEINTAQQTGRVA